MRLGADRERLAVVPCGVDLARFRPDGPAAQRRPGMRRLLCVGRLVERKGVGNAITALAELPDTELLVAGGPPREDLGSDPEAQRLRAVAERCGVADPPVAVRSSAVDEDGAGASFAGQHDTFLNVAGADQVWWAVARCAASFAGERALAYRRRTGLAARPARAAVLVQHLVPADAAGVVFSANPVSGARDEVVVNAALGLGESVVAGTVTPDAIVVGREDLAVLAYVIADKRRMTVAVPGGVREVAVPRSLAHVPAIDAAQARAAATLAIDLERETGRPVDLEVAWVGSELFLLQCRPITTLEPR
jgi:pyruvate,water dikinase